MGNATRRVVDDDADFEDQGRAVTLPTFHHENDRMEVFRVPKNLKKVADIAALYTVKLIEQAGEGFSYGIYLRGPEAPETKPILPAGYARYNDYKVFIRETNHVFGFVNRFKTYLEVEETIARLRLWKKGESIADKIALMIEEEDAKRRKAR